MDIPLHHAIMILLLDAVAIAIAVELGRSAQRGTDPTAAETRVFLLALGALGLAIALFWPLFAVSLIAAYLLRPSRLLRG